MVYEIDDIIGVSKKHKGETIRQILRYDSGYLKDLFLKNNSICFSKECMEEMGRLTKGFHDNWERPAKGGNVFSQLKTYATPYQYGFNEPDLVKENNKRLNSLNIF